MSGVRLPRPLLLLQHLPDTPTQAGTVRRREGSGFLYVFVFIKKSLARKNYSLKEWSFNCFPKLAFTETEFRFGNTFDAMIMSSVDIFVIQPARHYLLMDHFGPIRDTIKSRANSHL